MEYLTPNIIKKARERGTMLEEITITESIINVNKETLENCFDDLKKYIENNKNKETIEHIAYILSIAVHIRPRSRRKIVELIKLLLSASLLPEYCLRNHPTLTTMLKEVNLANPQEMQYYEENTIGNAIFEDNIEVLGKEHFSEKYEMFSRSIESFGFLDNRNFSMIELAALHGSIKCFKYLLLNSCETNKSISKLAVIGGNKEIITILMNKGIDFNDCSLVCFSYHRIDLYESLITKSSIDSASINQCIKFNNNAALCYIESVFGIQVIRNCVDNDTFRFAIMHGNYNAFSFYLKGVNLSNIFNEKDKSGNTLLHYACMKGFEKIATLMNENGADQVSMNNNKETPFHFAAKCCDDKLNVIIREEVKDAGYIIFTQKSEIKIAAQKHNTIPAIGNSLYRHPKSSNFSRSELEESISYTEFFDFLFALPDLKWNVNKPNKKGNKTTCTMSIQLEKLTSVFFITIDVTNKRILIKCLRPYLLNFQKINDKGYSFMIPRYDKSELNLIKKHQKEFKASSETFEMINTFVHRLFIGEKDIPSYLLDLFFSRSKIYQINKPDKVIINYSFLENLKGILEIQKESIPKEFNPTIDRLYIEGSAVHSLIYIDLRAFKVVQSSACIELDCTFEALYPYVLCVPVAIIKNEQVPLGFSIGPSESHYIYKNFYDLFESRFPGIIKHKVVLSDEGTGLISFCKLLKQENVDFVHFFCFKHIIGKFGASVRLSSIVSFLLYSFTPEEFIEKWHLKKKEIEEELVDSKHIKQFTDLFKCKFTQSGLTDPNIEKITQLPWIRSKYGVPLTTNHVESVHSKINQKIKHVRTLEDKMLIILDYIEKRYSTVHERRNLKEKIGEMTRKLKEINGFQDHKNCLAECMFYSKLYQIDNFPCIHNVNSFDKNSIPKLFAYDINSTNSLDINTSMNVIDQKNNEWNFKDHADFMKQKNVNTVLAKQNKSDKAKKIDNKVEDKKILLNMVLLNRKKMEYFTFTPKELDENEKLKLGIRYPALITNKDGKEHVFVPDLSMYSKEFIEKLFRDGFSTFSIISCSFIDVNDNKVTCNDVDGITKQLDDTKQVLIGFVVSENKK